MFYPCPSICLSVLSAKENRAITPERTKWLKSKIELGLPVMVPVLVYRFQMICLRGDLLY